LDESHRAKNGDAQRTRAVVALARTSPRVLLLSGTPATSRPIDLHAQLALLDPALFGTRREFGVRYCDAHEDARLGVWNDRGASREQELHMLLRETYVLRRLKEDVCAGLPPKLRERF